MKNNHNIKNKLTSGRLGKLIAFGKTVSDRITADRVCVYAAQASYFIVISAVPFVMLLLTLLRYIFTIDENEVCTLAAEYLPELLLPYADTIIEELFGNNLPIISVSAIAILWAASQGIKSIGQGIRNIYGTTGQAGFIRNTALSLFFTVISIIGVTVAAALVIFGRVITDYLDARFDIAIRQSGIFTLARLLFMPAVLILMLAGIYKGLCRHEMHFSRQFPGALIATGGWIIFSRAYSFYIDNFADYSYIYGSLTAVVLFMLWLYACMIILLCGAELNLWLYERRRNERAKLPPKGA